MIISFCSESFTASIAELKWTYKISFTLTKLFDFVDQMNLKYKYQISICNTIVHASIPNPLFYLSLEMSFGMPFLTYVSHCFHSLSHALCKVAVDWTALQGLRLLNTFYTFTNLNGVNKLILESLLIINRKFQKK